MYECTWPACLTEEQHVLLGESIDRGNMGLESLPQHMNLHCEKYGQCESRKGGQ